MSLVQLDLACEAKDKRVKAAYNEDEEAKQLVTPGDVITRYK